MLAKVLIPLFTKVNFSDDVWHGDIIYKKFGEVEVDESETIDGQILYTKLFDINFEKLKLYNGLEILKDKLLDEIPDGAISSVIIRCLEDPVDVIKYKVPFYLFDEIFSDEEKLQTNFRLSHSRLKNLFDLEDYIPSLQFLSSNIHYDDSKYKMEGPTESQYLHELYKLQDREINDDSIEKLKFGRTFKNGDIPISNISAFTLFNSEPVHEVPISEDFKNKVDELSKIDSEFYFKVTNELVIKPSYLMVKYNCFLNLIKSEEFKVSVVLNLPDKYATQFESLKNIGPNKYSMGVKNESNYSDLDKFKLLLDAAALRSSYDLSFFNLKHKKINFNKDDHFSEPDASNLPSISELNQLAKDPNKYLSFLMPVL